MVEREHFGARCLIRSAADRRMLVRSAAGKEFVGMRFTTQLNELSPRNANSISHSSRGRLAFASIIKLLELRALPTRIDRRCVLCTRYFSFTDFAIFHHPCRRGRLTSLEWRLAFDKGARDSASRPPGKFARA